MDFALLCINSKKKRDKYENGTDEQMYNIMNRINERKKNHISKNAKTIKKMRKEK